MKKIFNEFIFKDPANWKYWLTIAFLVKGIMLLLKLNLNPEAGNAFYGYFGGDTSSYFDPIDSFLEHGNYAPDYRMPGYGIIYLLSRLFFKKVLSYNLLVLLQFVLSTLSVYLLAKCVLRSFNSKELFYLTFFTFIISTYTSLYDTYLLSESFCVSFSIFALHFFILYFKHKKNISIFLSGLFMTWVVFLKPVFLPVLFAYSLILFFNQPLNKLKAAAILLYISSFVIVDGAWISRNYYKYNTISPLVRDITDYDFGEKFMLPLQQFIQSWGGNYVYWDPTAEIRWFGIRENGTSNHQALKDEKVKLPSYIYTSKFNYDSLFIIKNQISLLNQDVTPEAETRAGIEVNIITSLKKYTKSVKEEKKSLYYIKAPINSLKKLTCQPGTYNLFQKSYPDMNSLEKMVKIFYSVLYVSVFLFGTIGALLLIFKNMKLNILLMYLFIPLFTILVHGLIFRATENRYLVPAYPFLLISMNYLFLQIYYRIYNKGRF